jgi:hypothetical protein
MRGKKLPKRLRDRLDRVEKNKRDRNDSEIIARHADRLNREAMDALEYQRRLYSIPSTLA